MRHRLAKLICLFALGLTAFAQTRAADRSLAKPNIVILLADDLGYGELGCQGNTDIPTPHIDSIAANEVRFTNGYVTAPFCSASSSLSDPTLPRKSNRVDLKSDRLLGMAYCSSLSWRLSPYGYWDVSKAGITAHKGEDFTCLRSLGNLLLA